MEDPKRTPLFTSLGFDQHVLMTLLLRGWSIFAGGITLLLIPFGLSETQQGYYYAFASLIAMQAFFDLGFNSVIVQLVSHEFSHLQRDPATGQLQGNPNHRSRLASLLLLLRRWYRVAAMLFFVCLCPAGYLFFQGKGELSPSLWLGPWVLQICFTALNLYFSCFLAVSEGQGQVDLVAKLRLKQSIIGYSCFWVMLLTGAGLWVAPLLPAVSALMSAKWLRGRHDVLRFDPDPGVPPAYISWTKEIFPFQWRIALSWISGYFIFSFFTPMVFQHQGAVEAGRIGMTLSIFNSLSVLGMSWVSAKVPDLSMLIAQRRRQELNALFVSVLRKSFIGTALICFSAVLFIWVIRDIGFPPMQRLASTPVLVCLSVVTIVNTLIFSMAAYMRAHKEEPMLWNSVTMGAAVLAAVWFTSQVSVLTTMLAYMGLVTFLALPWTLLIFFRRYYHRTA
jgi:hypothetical protein